MLKQKFYLHWHKSNPSWFKYVQSIHECRSNNSKNILSAMSNHCFNKCFTRGHFCRNCPPFRSLFRGGISLTVKLDCKRV